MLYQTLTLSVTQEHLPIPCVFQISAAGAFRGCGVQAEEPPWGGHVPSQAACQWGPVQEGRVPAVRGEAFWLGGHWGRRGQVWVRHHWNSGTRSPVVLQRQRALCELVLIMLLCTLKLWIFYTNRFCFFVCLLFMCGTCIFLEWTKEVLDLTCLSEHRFCSLCPCVVTTAVCAFEPSISLCLFLLLFLVWVGGWGLDCKNKYILNWLSCHRYKEDKTKAGRESNLTMSVCGR